MSILDTSETLTIYIFFNLGLEMTITICIVKLIKWFIYQMGQRL